jgi:hypothetical protein
MLGEKQIQMQFGQTSIYDSGLIVTSFAEKLGMILSPGESTYRIRHRNFPLSEEGRLELEGELNRVIEEKANHSEMPEEFQACTNEGCHP